MNESDQSFEILNARIQRQRAANHIVQESLRQERRISERRLADIMGLRRMVDRLRAGGAADIEAEEIHLFSESEPPTVAARERRMATCMACGIALTAHRDSEHYTAFVAMHTPHGADRNVRERYRPGHGALWERGELEERYVGEIKRLQERIAAQKAEIRRLRGDSRADGIMRPDAIAALQRDEFRGPALDAKIQALIDSAGGDS